MNNNTSGSYNVALGSAAMSTSSSGDGNIVIGYNSQITTGLNYQNVIGFSALGPYFLFNLPTLFLPNVDLVEVVDGPFFAILISYKPFIRLTDCFKYSLALGEGVYISSLVCKFKTLSISLTNSVPCSFSLYNSIILSIALLQSPVVSS